MMDRVTSKVCVYRKVSQDGRIICQKIVQGDNEVSPNLCRDCPAKQVSCDKLRFCLQKSSPSPLVVRYGNGHCEVWDNEPARLSFLRAACTARIAPISDPRQCAACPLRTPAEPLSEDSPLSQVARGGKVIPFPPRVTLVAT